MIGPVGDDNCPEKIANTSDIPTISVEVADHAIPRRARPSCLRIAADAHARPAPRNTHAQNRSGAADSSGPNDGDLNELAARNANRAVSRCRAEAIARYHLARRVISPGSVRASTVGIPISTRSHVSGWLAWGSSPNEALARRGMTGPHQVSVVRGSFWLSVAAVGGGDVLSERQTPRSSGPTEVTETVVPLPADATRR